MIKVLSDGERIDSPSFLDRLAIPTVNSALLLDCYQNACLGWFQFVRIGAARNRSPFNSDLSASAFHGIITLHYDTLP